MKKFCIISVDRDDYVPRFGHPSIKNGLQSLENQTFKDFNVIIAHDGPKKISHYDEGVIDANTNLNITFLNMEEPMGAYGNYSRDYAMKYAYENNLGEYFLHHNIDNEYFPDALENINNAITENSENVFIFPIHHWKMLNGGILSGIPPIVCKIDAMQLVAHRDIWKSIDFWYNKHDLSDGYLYQEICEKYPWRHIDKCIGHNY